MSEIRENTEVNETTESMNESEGMDTEFESELDSKCEEYTKEGRSLEDIRRDKEELIHMREELIKYKESCETDTSESDDDDDPEKVLTLRRHR